MVWGMPGSRAVRVWAWKPAGCFPSRGVGATLTVLLVSFRRPAGRLTNSDERDFVTHPISYAPLALETLADLDSRIGGAFSKLAAELAQDCMNRPGEKGKRTLAVLIDLTPDQEADGTCEQVKTVVRLRANKPVYKTRDYGCLVTQAGFKFNTGDPTSPRQKTIQVDEYEGREVDG